MNSHGTKLYDWPRSGTPLTSVPMLEMDIGREEWAVAQSARRAKRYLGAIVYRDPKLIPHEPKRAAPRRLEGS